jgi:glutamate decarboxylase
MFLGWTYYGRLGYASMIQHAFGVAEYLFRLLSKSPNFVLVSKSPLPCLQVCFYWAKDGKLGATTEENDQLTEIIAQNLIPRGWMIDYAPGNNGKFFRAVVGRETRRETVDGLVKAIEEIVCKLRLADLPKVKGLVKD